MRCTDPEPAGMLIPYELGRLSQEEETLFEAHLLECESCFDDLKALSRVGAILHEFVGELPSPVAGRRPSRRRWTQAFAAALLLSAIAGYGLSELLRPDPPSSEQYQVHAAREATAVRDQAKVYLFRLLDRVRGRELLDRARELAEEQDSIFATILVEQIELRWCLLVTGDYQAALRVAEGIRDLYDQASPGDENTRADALNNLGVVREALAAAGEEPEENLRLAQHLFQESLLKREAAVDLEGLSWSLTNLGRVAILRGRPEESLGLLGKAIDIKRSLGDGDGLIGTKTNLALAQLLLGHPDLALDVLEPLLARAERRGDPYLLFDAKALLGRVLLALDRQEEALATVREAVTLGERLFSTPVRRKQIASLEALLAPGAGTSPGSALAVATLLY